MSRGVRRVMSREGEGSHEQRGVIGVMSRGCEWSHEQGRG